MRYYILIILILSCTKFLLQFVKDVDRKDKPLMTLFVAILHIIATVGYFNLMFTTNN
jgi:hypothetical protein